jgi:RNA polymerase sigma factor (sigma-70 family)
MSTVSAPQGRGFRSGDVTQYTDQRLLSRVAGGDDDAFDVFYRRHADKLLAFCHHMLGSRHEAEDAVQQSFFDAYRQVSRGVVPAHPKAWLYTIARNRSVTIMRSRREQPGEVELPSNAGVSEEAEQRAELQELVSDLHRLPEAQRSALVMFELGDLRQSDIAEVLGRDTEDVKSLVYQARNRLSARRRARQQSCDAVQRQLAVARGGELNARSLRYHLDGCPSCQAYLERVRRQRAGLAIVLPVVPLAAAHAKAAAAGGAAAGAAAGAHVAGRLTWFGKPAAGAAAATVAAAAVAVALTVGGGGKHAAGPAPAAAAPGGVVAPAARPAVHHRAAKRAHKPAAHHAVHVASKPPVAKPPLNKAVAKVPGAPPAPTPQSPSQPPHHPGGNPPSSPPPSPPSPPVPAPQPPVAAPAPSPPAAVAPPPVTVPPPAAVPPGKGHHYGQLPAGNGNHGGAHDNGNGNGGKHH